MSSLPESLRRMKSAPSGSFTIVTPVLPARSCGLAPLSLPASTFRIWLSAVVSMIIPSAVAPSSQD